MNCQRLTLGAAIIAGLVICVEEGWAQGLVEVCYVTKTGVMYLIDPSGTLPGDLPTGCKGSDDLHLYASWASLSAADGNVGIGVLEPTVALDVDGDIHATGQLKLGTNTMTLDGVANTITSGTNEDIAILPGGTGKVGIGTDSPSQLLTVAGAIESTSGGFKFPDGTTQTTAASGGGDGLFIPVDGVVAATDGFAVTGIQNNGSIPATGPGIRLMWYAGKAALRAGQVSGTEWDDANVGLGSTVLGLGTASGVGSAAIGVGNTAGGFGSVAMGDRVTATESSSVAIGRFASASGAYALAIGGSSNPGVGPAASGTSSAALGASATASGPDALAMGSATASGAYSIAMGQGSAASAGGAVAIGRENNAFGQLSVAIGLNNTTGGSSAVAIGRDNTANGSASIAMGQDNTATGSGSIAMGSLASTNGLEGTFVYGDGSALITAPLARSFTVKASGGSTFYSNGTATTGVRLTSGSGAWANLSDRNRKRDFEDVDGEAVLASIAGMPIQSWSYLSQEPSIRHLGPVAQDFYAAFGLGESDLTITTSDIDGVNMLAVQALEKRTRELQLENEELRADNDQLRERLDRVEATLRALSR